MIVEKLRKSILLAAFKGDLSDKFDSDTDLNTTISEIAKEKEVYLSVHKIKKTKLFDVKEQDEPFKIPSHWKWVRWGNLSNSIQYGVNAGALTKGNVKLVRISDIVDNKITWNTVPYSNINESEINQYILNENDILFARTGGTVGKSVIVKNIPKDEKYVFAGYLIRTNYSNQVNYKYLKYFMESPLYWSQLKSGTKGSAQPNCNGQTLSKIIIPLPPVEEQQRIVDKIEELFAKLDEVKPIEEELKLIKNNFPNDMKKSILFSAISGKLSVQNNNDTPVDNQLEKIKRESEQFYLINEIKNSHRKNHDYKFFTDDTYVIPATWKYVPLSSTCLSIFSGKSPKYVKYNNDNLILGQKVNQGDGLHFEDLKYGTDEFIKSLPKYQFLIKNDVLLNTLGGGSVGRCGIFDNDIPNITTDGHIFVIRTAGFTNEKYIMYFLRLYREKLEEYANGTTNQKFFNIKQIEDVMIPLPPIEEQKRIVDKIEQLLSLCNDIEKLISK